jgi:purine-binding chemotaxis protein CheW
MPETETSDGSHGFQSQPDGPERPKVDDESVGVSSASPSDMTKSLPANFRRIDSSSREWEKDISTQNEKAVRAVIFNLAGQTYAVEVELVEEIIPAPKVSPLIKAPFFVEGVMKLRGRIVPVVDLQKAMRIPAPERDQRDSVVVMVKIRERRIGFRVDSVTELLSIPITLIEAPGGIVSGVDARFIKGLVYIGERFMVILDLESILSLDYDSILQDGYISDSPVPLSEIPLQDETFGARKIISFVLDDELFGAEIDEVAEIMEMTKIMPIPNVADFVLGLINLRGTIVPVVDLKARLGLSRRAWTGDSRIVIMKEGNLLVGVVVDSMWESLRLTREAFQPTPQGVAKMDAEYFREICVAKGRMVNVLDIAKIIADTSARNSVTGRIEALEARSTLKLESHT